MERWSDEYTSKNDNPEVLVWIFWRFDIVAPTYRTFSIGLAHYLIVNARFCLKRISLYGCVQSFISQGISITISFSMQSPIHMVISFTATLYLVVQNKPSGRESVCLNSTLHCNCNFSIALYYVSLLSGIRNMMIDISIWNRWSIYKSKYQ